ncbi:hypothetical protein GCM10010358_24450 [Streptomyces minutiscleroticus]|uniref:Uncharacterized protein n=1 Tax=Streptomyces minutiscleroticus TaxID=68238 RepID=A0A918KP51_9ACTN|nr:hypothetical protein GCM10010358_24450 [Streptomyces minutiscleroticus]
MRGSAARGVNMNACCSRVRCHDPCAGKGRNRLAVLAESRGTAIRSLAQECAETTSTQEERRERAEWTRTYVAEHFGVEVTDEESAGVRTQAGGCVRPADRRALRDPAASGGGRSHAADSLGDRRVSALIQRAHFEPETRLWAPVLSVLEADADHPGLAEHVGRLKRHSHRRPETVRWYRL